MPDVHTATQEAHCAVCGEACTPCTNTCTCPNLPANAEYFSGRHKSEASFAQPETFVGTISTHAHGPGDFH